MKAKALLIAALAGLFSVQAQEMTDEEIAQRIKPTGSVHVAGAAPAAAAAAGPRSGADIYNSACVACHSAGVLGAPKLAKCR